MNSNAESMDHSFVAFSDRTTKSLAPTTTTSSSNPVVPPKSKSDVLVVSSLADKPKSQKKRNRTKVDAAVETAGGSQGANDEILPTPPKKAKKTKPAEVLEPFDYSANKSILDAEPGAGGKLGGGAGGGKKTRKEKEEGKKGPKGFTVDQSDFRRAPRLVFFSGLDSGGMETDVLLRRVNNAPKKGALSSSFAK